MEWEGFRGFFVFMYVCLHIGHIHVNNIRYFFGSVHTFPYLEPINYQPLLSAVNFLRSAGKLIEKHRLYARLFFFSFMSG